VNSGRRLAILTPKWAGQAALELVMIESPAGLMPNEEEDDDHQDEDGHQAQGGGGGKS